MSAEVACATRGNHCFARRNTGANRESMIDHDEHFQFESDS